MRIGRAVALLGLLALLLSSVLAPVAEAADDFGPWFPAPGKGNSHAYQVDVGAFNSNEVEMAVSFACVLDDGTVLREHEQEILKNTFMYAGLVYAGEFSFGKVHDDVDKSKVSKNGGYPSGRKGMQMFLRDMVSLIRVNTWAPKDHWEVVKADFDDGGGPFGFVGDATDWFVDKAKGGVRTIIKEGSKVVGGAAGVAVGGVVADFVVPEEEDDGTWLLQKWWRPGGNSDLAVRVSEEAAKPFRIEAARVSKIAGLINIDAANPLALYAQGAKKGSQRNKLPAGCDLGGYVPPDGPKFSDLLSDKFYETWVQIVFALPAHFGGSLWNVAFGPALKLNFWTPHSERGDTYFNVVDSCDPSTAETPQQRTRLLNKISTQCDSGKPLGFDKRRFNPEDQPKWLWIREFLQWLVSGTYFIILFTSALVFMVRGTASQTWNVMRLVPRLILSILFTIFSAFIIGAVISTSNLLIQALVGSGNQASLSMLNAIVQHAWIAAGVGEGLRNVLDAIVILPMGLFAIGLVIIGIIRQITLIGLVLLAPVAGFCLIIEKWRHWFNRWWAMLLVVCGLPLIMAGVLRIALMINPLLTNTGASYGTLLGFFGVILIVATMWFLLVLARRVMASAFNSRLLSGSISGQLAGALGGALSSVPNPWAQALGMAARGYASASGALDKVSAKMIPQGKIMAATHAGPVLPKGKGTPQLTGGGLVDKGIGKTLTAAHRLQKWMTERTGGADFRQLSADEISNFASLAQQYAGIDATEWSQLAPAKQAEYIQQVTGFEQVRATRDGRFLVNEGAQIRDARRQNALAAAQRIARGEAASAGNAWRSARQPGLEGGALQAAQQRLREEPLRPDGAPQPGAEFPPEGGPQVEQQAQQRLNDGPVRPDGQGIDPDNEARRNSRLNRYSSEA